VKFARLGDVALIQRHSVDPSKIAPNTIYIGLEHLERGGRIIGHDTVGNAELASSKFMFSAQHLLYGKLRPNLGKISRPNFSGVCSTDILPVLPGSQLNRDYLAHYLAQPIMVELASSRAAGANLPRLSPATLEDFEIPLPPIEEQQRIAAILDRVDALRAKRRLVLTHLDSLKRAAFHRLFAQSRVEQISLAEAAEVWDCAHTTPRWQETGLICLRTSNLIRGGWKWEDTRYVDSEQFSRRSKGGGALPGDIILSREGTVGIGAIVTQGMQVAMGQRLVQVRFNPQLVLAQYGLEYLLRELAPERISKSMVGSTSQHLNVRDLRALPIPLVKMEDQRRFAFVESSLSKRSLLLEQALASDDALFASLQSRAFRGEL
jgi:type I restriction enzyme S subunit